MEDVLMTARDLRTKLGLSDWQVTRLVKSGELPVIRLGKKKNSHLRFRREDVDAWLERSREPGG